MEVRARKPDEKKSKEANEIRHLRVQLITVRKQNVS